MNFSYDTAKIQQNISGYTGLIFAICSPYESALGADDRSGPLSDLSMDADMATNYC